METLQKSFDAFRRRYGGRVFFRAISQRPAERIISAGRVSSQDLPMPIYLDCSLERAGNYLPNCPTIEFRLKRDARVVDVILFPRSNTGTWDATLPPDLDEESANGRTSLAKRGLADGFFHEVAEMLEVYNCDILVPVKMHSPLVQEDE